MSVPDRIREAVQAVLDEDGDGWTVPYLVVAMGIERMREDGSIEAASWYYAPAEQAEWTQSRRRTASVPKTRAHLVATAAESAVAAARVDDAAMEALMFEVAAALPTALENSATRRKSSTEIKS